SSAYEPLIAEKLRNSAKRRPNARATSPARVGFLNVMGSNLLSQDIAVRVSERGGIGLAGADAHGGVEAQHEDFSVPDLTRLGGGGDGVDGFVDLIGCDRDFDLDLRQEAHRIFRAAIDLRVALLAPVA